MKRQQNHADVIISQVTMTSNNEQKKKDWQETHIGNNFSRSIINNNINNDINYNNINNNNEMSGIRNNNTNESY